MRQSTRASPERRDGARVSSEPSACDHWCEKGHILLCLAGELETELADGRRFHLAPGMSYQVADGAEAHRSYSRTGAMLFIVD
jgi:hypothetical protein